MPFLNLTTAIKSIILKVSDNITEYNMALVFRSEFEESIQVIALKKTICYTIIQ